MSRTALVTGGSAGIGLATCRELLAAGYQVVSLDQKPSLMQDPKLHVVIADLTDAQATEAAAARIARDFAPTVIVHNAGAMRPALLADVTRADLEALASLHLGAAVTLVQAALPAMRAVGFGRVVLISSRAIQGLATRSSYAATKAGMIGLARTWALELGPDGITVNVIAPGPIETDIFHEILPVGDPRIERMAAGIPVRRLGQPKDVSRAILFLVAEDAGFITGQTLFVCGGTSVGSLTI
jgi:NAD(P)-dependent dehydrogenase (short-subunit alcohol dehydrogenase family)